MNGKDIGINEFVTFSNLLDDAIASDNQAATHILIAAIKRAFGYEVATVRYEVRGEPEAPWIFCLAPSFPEMESAPDIFSENPFCAYMIENAGKNRFTTASDCCDNFSGTGLAQVMHRCGVRYAGAISLTDIWNQSLLIIFFKADEDFSDSERSAILALNRMLDSKCRLRNLAIEAEVMRYMMNDLFDSRAMGTVILDDKLEIVDSNRLFDEYYRGAITSGDIRTFLRSLIRVYEGAAYKEDLHGKRRYIMIDNFTITIQTEFADKGSAAKSAKYFSITIEEHRQDRALEQPNTAQRGEFAKRYNLSPREMDIVDALATGCRYQDVADKLYISLSTVRTHVKNIYRKLDINNQRALLSKYIDIQGRET